MVGAGEVKTDGGGDGPDRGGDDGVPVLVMARVMRRVMTGDDAANSVS